MNGYRKASVAAQRFAERRQREDEAPRLRDEVPDLLTLRLSFEERSLHGSLDAPKHLRHVVVANAPALFVLVCGDSRCVEGGHDVTTQIMGELRAHRSHFEGHHTCLGTVGTAACGRILHFEAEAEYKSS